MQRGLPLNIHLYIWDVCADAFYVRRRKRANHWKAYVSFSWYVACYLTHCRLCMCMYVMYVMHVWMNGWMDKSSCYV